MITINKAAGIIIKDKKLLVAREHNKKTYVSPGGAMRNNEKATRSLARELMEEVGIIVLEADMQKYGIYTAVAANDPDKMVSIEVFMVLNWKNDIKPCGEIEEIAWVTSDNSDNLSLGSIFEHNVIPKLKESHLID